MFAILRFTTNSASRLSRHAGISSQRISQGSTSPSFTLEISYRVGDVICVPTAEGCGVQLHDPADLWKTFSCHPSTNLLINWIVANILGKKFHPNPSTAFSERLGLFRQSSLHENIFPASFDRKNRLQKQGPRCGDLRIRFGSLGWNESAMSCRDLGMKYQSFGQAWRYIFPP